MLELISGAKRLLDYQRRLRLAFSFLRLHTLWLIFEQAPVTFSCTMTLFASSLDCISFVLTVFMVQLSAEGIAYIVSALAKDPQQAGAIVFTSVD